MYKSCSSILESIRLSPSLSPNRSVIYKIRYLLQLTHYIDLK